MNIVTRIYRLLALYAVHGRRAIYLRLVAWLTFKLMAQYRRRMEENIALTLGKEISSEAERKELAWRAWKNFARGVLDTTAVMHYSKERIIGSVRLDGEEHLPERVGQRQRRARFERASRQLYLDRCAFGSGRLSIQCGGEASAPTNGLPGSPMTTGRKSAFTRSPPSLGARRCAACSKHCGKIASCW